MSHHDDVNVVAQDHDNNNVHAIANATSRGGTRGRMSSATHVHAPQVVELAPDRRNVLHGDYDGGAQTFAS